MQQLRHCAVFILGFTAFVATAAAQKPPLRASDFNVEILNLDDRPPVLVLYEPPARSAYIAHVNLKRISDWKPSAEVPAEASALRLQFWLEGNTPHLKVTAYLDKIVPRSNPEWEKMATTKVVSRALAQDGTVTISETERFGIQPFQVRTIRAQPWSVGPPLITNKTQALNVDSVSEARPTYTLKVRNVSHKAINAIHSYGLENDRKQGGSGSSATPLIPAGRIFVIQQRFDLTEERLKTKAQATKREIVIAAVVFDDGSFEGEPDVAAEMAADMVGNRIQLTRVIPLLRKLAARPGGDSNELKMLQKDIAALPEDVDSGVVEELIERFATASEDMRNRRIKEEIGNGLRSLKRHVLREIEKFDLRSAPASNVDFSRWLNDLIDNLERTHAH
jgi:hypothetical protein